MSNLVCLKVGKLIGVIASLGVSVSIASAACKVSQAGALCNNGTTAATIQVTCDKKHSASITVGVDIDVSAVIAKICEALGNKWCSTIAEVVKVSVSGASATWTYTYTTTETYNAPARNCQPQSHIWTCANAETGKDGCKPYTFQCMALCTYDDCNDLPVTAVVSTGPYNVNIAHGDECPGA